MKNFYIFSFCLLLSAAVVAQTEVSVSSNTTYASLTNTNLTVSGKTDVHLTASTAVLTASTINLTGGEAYLFFDNVKPSVVNSTYLSSVKIDGAAATTTNSRVAIYKHGTMIMPNYNTTALTVYTDSNSTGNSQTMAVNTYYKKNSGLTYNNQISSFKLRRGYMATFANNADGTGYSQIFIARENDLEQNLPAGLNNKVSFVRVFKWERVTKKGWAGTGSSYNDCDKVDGTWYYTWSADQNSRPNNEYVPIKQNLSWPGWSEIDGKANVSHVLGYNEPDHAEQSNVTVEQAIKEYPNFLKSGLRIGAPSTTDFSWVYKLVEMIDSMNYRLDFISMHGYWASTNGSNYKSSIQGIYDRTKRPVWIKEWNNGANWTNETWPTSDHSASDANLEKNRKDITAIVGVMDALDCLERYSIYNWVQDCRAMILNGNLTPAGTFYKNNKSKEAYNPNYQYNRQPNLGVPTSQFFTCAAAANGRTFALRFPDVNGEVGDGYEIQRAVNDSTVWRTVGFVPRGDDTNTNTLTFTDSNTPLNWTKIRYRVRAKLGNTYSTKNNVPLYSNIITVKPTGALSLQKLADVLADKLLNLTRYMDFSGYQAYYEVIADAQSKLASGDFASVTAIETVIQGLHRAEITCMLTNSSAAEVTARINNPSFEYQMTGWTNNGFSAVSDVLFEKTGTYYAQKKGSVGIAVAAATVTQTVSGLTNGTYTLVARAQSVKQADNTAATGGSLTAGNISKAVGLSDIYFVYDIPVTDGTLAVGAKIAGAVADWVAVDNFRLIYNGLSADGEDVSSYIQNPSFEDATAFAGWINNGFYLRYNDTFAKDGSKYADYSTTPISNVSIEQTVDSLPSGNYKLKVRAQAIVTAGNETTAAEGAYIFANTAKTFAGKVGDYVINNIAIPEKTSLLIGFRAENSNATRVSVDFFRLFRVSDYTATPKIDASATLIRTEYYNLQGIIITDKIENLPKSTLYIERKIYDNGQVTTNKKFFNQ